MSAVTFLNTSTRLSSSGDTSLKLSSRPPVAEKISRPFSSDRAKGRPRMMTPVPSTEKRSGSVVFSNRPMVMPGMRCSVSATERSGSAPISSAVTASTKVSESRLMFWAFCSEARKPETMISPSVGSVTTSSSSELVASCANAGEASAADKARHDAVPRAKIRRDGAWLANCIMFQTSPCRVTDSCRSLRVADVFLADLVSVLKTCNRGFILHSGNTWRGGRNPR